MRRTNIFLENPLDPTNVGCIIRDVYAFDAGTLYYPKSFKTKISKFHGCACGTENKVRIQKFDDATDFLKKTNFRKIGFVAQTNATLITDPDFKFKDGDLLIFGNEKTGLTNEAKQLCDELVTIPTLGYMACLNVAHSVAISLYEVLRQKIEIGAITIKKNKVIE